MSVRLPLFGVPEAMTRRLAAVVLVSQAVIVLFGAVGARALAQASVGSGVGAQQDHAATFLVVGTVLAIAAVLAAGLLRGPAGLPLGWLVQVATVGSAVVMPAMIIAGVIFGALWITALIQGRKMDELTRTRAAGNAGH